MEGVFEQGGSFARTPKLQHEEPACDQLSLPATDCSSTQSQQQLFRQDSHQYNYDVVNPPTDESICPVCLDLAIQPFLVECCGQHFCQQCLSNVRAKGNVCPLCRGKAPPAVHDKYFERNVIHKLQVRCNEKSNGCQWEGLLGELQRHLTDCQYFEEECPCKCGDRVQRRYLEEHVAKLCPQRSYNCGYCDYHGAYREVIDEHWSLCMSFPLDCPNNCGTKDILRRDLQEHCDSMCPLQEVTCDFSHAGCKVRVVRQDLAQHMSDAAQQHMALVSRTLLQEKEREIAQLKQQLREKEQKHKEEIENKDQLHCEERKKNGQRHLLELAKKDRECNLEIAMIVEHHNVALEKKDQLHKEEQMKNNEQHKQEMERKDNEHNQEMARKDDEHKQEMARKDEEHRKEIGMLEDLRRAHIEKSSRMYSVLGSEEHTLVLTGYQKKRKKGVDWYSSPYYTHLYGYRMGINVQLLPSCTELCVYSHLLPGAYDDGLKWPFRGTLVVLLLNQLSNTNHYDYVFDYSRASDRESQMVKSGERSGNKISSTPYLSITLLEDRSSKKCQYLKNDCIKFKVFVKDL